MGTSAQQVVVTLGVSDQCHQDPALAVNLVVHMLPGLCPLQVMNLQADPQTPSQRHSGDIIRLTPAARVRIAPVHRRKNILQAEGLHVPVQTHIESYILTVRRTSANSRQIQTGRGSKAYLTCTPSAARAACKKPSKNSV